MSVRFVKAVHDGGVRHDPAELRRLAEKGIK
jgi:hypothetical protein